MPSPPAYPSWRSQPALHFPSRRDAGLVSKKSHLHTELHTHRPGAQQAACPQSMALLPPSGPRLAGRLTADLVLSSPQGFNAVKDYSIDLRGTTTQRCATRTPGVYGGGTGRAQGFPPKEGGAPVCLWLALRLAYTLGGSPSCVAGWLSHRAALPVCAVGGAREQP